jgi:hypothetical protein
MPAVNGVKEHRLNFIARFWNRLGEVDNPDASEVLNELPAEDRKILNEASESVKFEPIIVNTNVGGASSKKSINRESNEPQKVQATRENKGDDLVR